MRKEKVTKELKQSKGITLIALIVTIIVLLILAGVTIAQITGNESTPNKAVEAKNKNEQGAEMDAISVAAVSAVAEGGYNLYVDIESLQKSLKDLIEEEPEEVITGEGPWVVTGKKSKTKYVIDSEGQVYKKETPEIVTEDENLIVVNVGSFAALKGYEKLPTTKNLKAIKNAGQTNEQQMVVPAGFTVVEGNKLEDGMVIRDATYTNTINSEFVWVPVGQTLTFADETTGSINLSRYSFDTSTGAATQQDSDTLIDTYYTETTSNTAARKTNNNTKIEFVEKTKENKGYYIGRYEAGVENGTYDNTNKTWNSIDGINPIKIVCKQGVTVYNHVKRGEVSGHSGALDLAEGMYSNDTKLKSELLTSFAWDTAVVFIEKCGTNSNYANRKRFQISLTTTGDAQDSSNNRDVQCNIYDMASNVREWTTENSNDSDLPYVARGGTFQKAGFYVSFRDNNETTVDDFFVGFRPILYII